MTHPDLKKLLEDNPLGVIILPGGTVYKVVQPASNIQALVRTYPLPPPSGGYYVVEDAGEVLDIE